MSVAVFRASTGSEKSRFVSGLDGMLPEKKELPYEKMEPSAAT